MGLKEKQALAGLDFGWAVNRIKEYTGSDIKFEPDSATFDDIEAIYMIVNQGADYMANAIASVCGDAIGKEAFNAKGFKTVSLINHKEKGKAKIAFNGSTLELHGTWGEADRQYLSAGDIQKQLENML